MLRGLSVLFADEIIYTFRIGCFLHVLPLHLLQLPLPRSRAALEDASRAGLLIELDAVAQPHHESPRRARFFPLLPPL